MSALHGRIKEGVSLESGPPTVEGRVGGNESRGREGADAARQLLIINRTRSPVRALPGRRDALLAAPFAGPFSVGLVPE